jgi:hypothetical protein
MMPTRRSPKSPRRTATRKGASRLAPAPAATFNPLDQDRAASMADEGGRAAAEVEREAIDPAREGRPILPEVPSSSRSRYGLWVMGLAVGLLVLAFALRRR